MKSVLPAEIDNFEPNKVPIVALVERTGTRLTKIGNLYSGLCPFHADKDTPSLRVYESSNSWCCFGNCGERIGKHNGGGPIEWVKQKYSLDYRSAIEWLRTNFYHLPPVVKKEVLKVEERPVVPSLILYWHSLLDSNDRRKYFHERGFTDDLINFEKFGWDGQRYIIPVWEGEPGNSVCLGVRRRRADSAEGPKYLGLKGHNAPTVWGRWHCRGSNLILSFAGELDAARAVQDGFPAFSVVNGINALSRFPESWPDLWFPDSTFCLAIWDKKEEVEAGCLAEAWSRCKGSLTGRVIHFPPEFSGKDYCEFRDQGYTAKDFHDLIMRQLL